MDTAPFEADRQRAFALIKRRIQDNNIRLDVAGDVMYETPLRTIGGHICRFELECPVRNGTKICPVIGFCIYEGTTSQVGSLKLWIDLIYQVQNSLWYAERGEDGMRGGPIPQLGQLLPSNEMEISEMRMLAILDKLIEFYLQAT